MSRRPYHRPVKTTWWLSRTPYLLFMLRELTAVFVAAYALILLCGIHHLAEGPEAWDAYLAAVRSPVSLAFHAIALIFAIYHSVTWFNLTPKVMVVRLGEWRAPAPLIMGPHYAAWLLVSAAIAWLVIGG